MDTENQAQLPSQDSNTNPLRTKETGWRDVEAGDANQPIPDNAGPDDWTIELRYLPIADYGHAFLALRDRNGNVQRELHALSRSRNATNELLAFGPDGSRLSGVQTDRPLFDGPGDSSRTKLISNVYSGSHDDAQAKWQSALQAAAQMNSKDLDYKSFDLSYPMGTNGGQIQNSNSGNYTFGKFAHLDLATELRNKGMERTFPGFGRDLLDPTYQPYVAPEFPPKNNR